ncbi:MAG: methyltransferase domain-containing protein [Bacteroidia bacterium]|nr:methyltransferase domain-containing protein [Bacteroidia bacterium]
MTDVYRAPDDARKSYDKLSKWYDSLTGPFKKKYKEAGIKKLSPIAGENILEIGFGTGQDIISIARKIGDSGKVTGIDISPEMLKITREKIRKESLLSRVELQCADATKLNFSDGSFDAVLLSFTLEFFPTKEIPVVLNECKRVLKKYGRIVVLSLSRRKENNAVLLYEWVHEKFPSLADCRPIFAKEMLSDCGFEIADVEELSLYSLPVDIVSAIKPG